MLQGHHLAIVFLPKIMIKYPDHTPICTRTPPLHKFIARMYDMRRVEGKNSYKESISGNIDEAKDTEVAGRHLTPYL